MRHTVFGFFIFLLITASVHAAPKVLIVTQKSAFKDQLVAEIQKGLNSDRYDISIIPLTSLLKENVTAFNAIVIINTCMAWQVNGTVKKFLKSQPDSVKKHTVLFTTVGGEDWAPSGLGVDCVTSASNKDKIPMLAKRVMSSVRISIHNQK